MWVREVIFPVYCPFTHYFLPFLVEQTKEFVAWKTYFFPLGPVPGFPGFVIIV